tara:strand:- start:205 stop:522 length:318 start_codon:yes stop_codon:yes gene_type:complete
MGKAYVIAHPKVTDMDKFMTEYASKVDATVEAFGGKFLVRTPETLVHEGDKGTLAVVIEFESKEKAMGWYKSDAHQQIVGKRRAYTDEKSHWMICEESSTMKKGE